jgi:hypothetical protein
MKTLNLKQIAIAVIATIIIVGFATAAAIHIVHLTEAGLINWKN